MNAAPGTHDYRSDADLSLLKHVHVYIEDAHDRMIVPLDAHVMSLRGHRLARSSSAEATIGSRHMYRSALCAPCDVSPTCASVEEALCSVM